MGQGHILCVSGPRTKHWCRVWIPLVPLRRGAASSCNPCSPTRGSSFDGHAWGFIGSRRAPGSHRASSTRNDKQQPRHAGLGQRPTMFAWRKGQIATKTRGVWDEAPVGHRRREQHWPVRAQSTLQRSFGKGRGLLLRARFFTAGVQRCLDPLLGRREGRHAATGCAIPQGCLPPPPQRVPLAR